MKHILSRVISIFTLLLMANWCHAEGAWVRTELSELTNSDVFVIVDIHTKNALPYSGKTEKPLVEGVSLNEDCSQLVSTVSERIKWKLQLSEKYYYFYPITAIGSRLYILNDNAGVRIGPNYSDAERFAYYESDNYVGLLNIKFQRYLGVYNNQDWRCYNNINSTIANTQIAYYRYVEIASEPTTVTLIDNGQTTIAEAYVGSSYPLPTQGSSVEGLEFMGWSRAPIVAGAPIADVAILSPGTSVKVEENMIFYAVYAKPVYTGEKAYVKIEGEQADWSGIYLIVCESAGKVFNGSLGFTNENAVDVEISENKIAFNDETKLYEFRIEKYGDGYSIKSDTSKYYIGSKGGESWSSKTLSSEGEFTISCSDKPLKANSAYLWYMSKKFAFSYSANTPIQLYKRTDVTKSYAFYTTFASISVNSYGYATWYSGIPVEVPAGVTAYTCQVEGNTAMLHAVGAVIPAHTGVVLYAPEAVGKGQNFVLRYADVDTTPIANNALIGFVKDTEVDNGKAHYALNVKDKKVGFYIPKTTTTETEPSATSAFTAKAGKAYLELDAQVSVSALALKRIDDVSVNHISTSSDDIIYDLMGRKVSAPSQGVYIVNGRKVVLTGEKYKTK
ncbi:MAG: hypothetical protein IKY84_01445 [Bacteroidaceae bacterium]|nr:hypothetical protein [Bacteroidaceae bacterium]